MKLSEHFPHYYSYSGAALPHHGTPSNTLSNLAWVCINKPLYNSLLVSVREGLRGPRTHIEKYFVAYNFFSISSRVAVR